MFSLFLFCQNSLKPSLKTKKLCYIVYKNQAEVKNNYWNSRNRWMKTFLWVKFWENLQAFLRLLRLIWKFQSSCSFHTPTFQADSVITLNAKPTSAREILHQLLTSPYELFFFWIQPQTFLNIVFPQRWTFPSSKENHQKKMRLKFLHIERKSFRVWKVQSTISCVHVCCLKCSPSCFSYSNTKNSIPW